MTDDKMKGKMEEVKGKAKQAVGDMTDNDKTHAEGKAEETKGKARQAMGDVKNAVKDITD